MARTAELSQGSSSGKKGAGGLAEQEEAGAGRAAPPLAGLSGTCSPCPEEGAGADCYCTIGGGEDLLSHPDSSGPSSGICVSSAGGESEVDSAFQGPLPCLGSAHWTPHRSFSCGPGLFQRGHPLLSEDWKSWEGLWLSSRLHRAPSFGSHLQESQKMSGNKASPQPGTS